MVAIHSKLLNGFVHCSEATRDLGAVSVRKLVGKCDEVLLLRNHVVGHSAIALPTVGTPVFFVGAGDHVSTPTIVTDSAAGNVVDDHPVVQIKAPTAWANFYDLTTGLVAGNHSLITLRPFPEVLVVDATDIGTTDR